jgi:kinetochore protein Nuf2
MRQGIESRINLEEKNLKRCERESQRNAEETKKLEEEINEMERELREHYKAQRSKIQEIERIKREKTEISDKYSSEQLILLNLKQDVACLKTQIVSDPTKLMELLNEMRDMILKEKECIKSLEVRRNRLNEKIIEFNGLREDLMRIIKVSVKIQEEEKKIDKLKREISDTESEVLSYDSSINTLKNKKNNILRQISQIECKAYNLRDKNKKHTDEITKQLENLKLDYNKMSEERDDIQNKIEENIKKTKSMEYEMVKIKNKHEGEVVDIQSELCILKDVLWTYFSETKAYFN